jgi:hypothetical protein
MTNRINSSEWLAEQDIPPMGGQPDVGAGGPPMSQPGMPQDPMGTGDQQSDPNAMSMDGQPGEEDIAQDPQYPEMPEGGEEDDFEVWKIKYVKESIKGDPNALTEMIMRVRDREPTQVRRRQSRHQFLETELQPVRSIYRGPQTHQERLR